MAQRSPGKAGLLVKDKPPFNPAAFLAQFLKRYWMIILWLPQILQLFGIGMGPEQAIRAAALRPQSRQPSRRMLSQGHVDAPTWKGRWLLRQAAPAKADSRAAAACAAQLALPKVALLFATEAGTVAQGAAWTQWLQQASGLVPLTPALSQQLCSEERFAAVSAACSVQGSGHEATHLDWRHLFSVHVHAPVGSAATPAPAGSAFWGAQLAEQVAGGMQDMALVNATRALLREALKDPLVEHLVVVNDASIPLYPAPTTYYHLVHGGKSRVDACKGEGVDLSEERWLDGMASASLSRRHWRKSAPWVTLSRHHAQLVVEDTYVHGRFLEYLDDASSHAAEHFVPTLLASLGEEQGTDCKGAALGFIPSHKDGRPVRFKEGDVDAQLLATLRSEEDPECSLPALSTARISDSFKPLSSLLGTGPLCGLRPPKEAPLLAPACSLFGQGFGPETVTAVNKVLASCSAKAPVLGSAHCKS